MVFNFYRRRKDLREYRTFAPVKIEPNIFGSKEKITEEYKEGKIVITKVAGGKAETQEIAKDGQTDNIYGTIYRYRALEVYA
jgi:hypothetical protein